MRISITALLLTIGIFASGCVHRADRFALSAQLLEPSQPGASTRLAIRVRNISDITQQVMMLTNLFEGDVYLRDRNGEVRCFVHTNYWVMCMTAFWVPPKVSLAPRESLRFEAPLSDFMCPDQHRVTMTDTSYSIWFPTLATQFRPGCEIWCALDVRQLRPIEDGHFTAAVTASLVTATIRHSGRTSRTDVGPLRSFTAMK